MVVLMVMMVIVASRCITATRALQLCSVPLDVAYSLQSLRTALSKSAYTARSLRNSRQLLALYLAGSTELPPDTSGNHSPNSVQPARSITALNRLLLSLWARY